MKTRYSKSTGNFYPFEFDYQSLPEDIIEVSIDDYNTAMSNSRDNSYDFVDGKLVLTPRKLPSFTDLSARVFLNVRVDREIVLNRIANMAAFAGEADKAALALSRQLLLDVTDADAVVAATTVEELEQAFKYEFRLATANIQHVLNGTFAEVK